MKKEGLASKTVRNYLTTLRSMWESACDEYGWELRDPFRDLEGFIPDKVQAEGPEGLNPPGLVWRFDEVMLIIDHMDARQRNVTVFMFLTGLIASEIAGLRKEDIQRDYLLVRNFTTRKEQDKKIGKKKSRRRKIKITQAIRRCLDEAVLNSDDEYLFKTVNGLPFAEGTFRKNFWVPALKAAGFDYKKPYSTRHTFAAWSLLIGIIPTHLVAKMGHASKKMVYEEYGEWVEGLEEDKKKILGYMGKDYIFPENVYIFPEKSNEDSPD